MADKTIVNVGLKNGKTVKFSLDEENREKFYGLKIGDEFSGELLSQDYSDYKLKITGGTDEDGIPMRFDLEGTERRRILFGSKTIGFRAKKIKNPNAAERKMVNLRKGTRLKKLVRGSEIFDDIVQINTQVIEEGSKPME